MLPSHRGAIKPSQLSLVPRLPPRPVQTLRRELLGPCSRAAAPDSPAAWLGAPGPSASTPDPCPCVADRVRLLGTAGEAISLCGTLTEELRSPTSFGFHGRSLSFLQTEDGEHRFTQLVGGQSRTLNKLWWIQNPSSAYSFVSSTGQGHTSWEKKIYAIPHQLTKRADGSLVSQPGKQEPSCVCQASFL